MLIEVSVGLLVGYVAASVGESLQHRVFGHGARWLRTRVGGLGRVRNFLEGIYWSHTVIHHGRTFRKDFVTAFRTPEEREALLATMSPDQRHTALRTRFGLTIPLDSYPWFLWLPLLATALLGWQMGMVAAASSIPPLLLPPMLSRSLHPLIHRPYSEALAEARGIARWIVGSRYGRAMIRHHWMHHRYPRCNFNLLLIGDRLLGTHRTATAEDLRQMRAQGIPTESTTAGR